MESVSAAKLFASAIAAVLMGGAASAGEPLETGIKATYLYKFAPFVDWPASAFASPDAPVTICVAGADPFGPSLDQVAARQRVEGRAIAVRHMNAVQAGSGCQIVYLSGSAEQSVAQGLSALRGQPVLTVTDGLEPGAHGIISFVIADGRVRFAIDISMAEESHIVISSKLLSLAVQPK